MGEGSTIGHHYDPMIAKLVVHGPTRREARARLLKALDEFEVSGVQSNIAFLRAAAGCNSFLKGGVDTGFIECEFGNLGSGSEPPSSAVALAALAGTYGSAAQARHAGFAIWESQAQRVELRCGSRVYVALVRLSAPGVCIAEVSGTTHIGIAEEGEWKVDGAKPDAPVRVLDSLVSVTLEGYWEFSVVDHLSRRSGSIESSNLVVSPMPGLVSAVHAAEGDIVRPGSRIATIESMKMETAVTASLEGTIASVAVAGGDQVQEGAVLATILAGAEPNA